MSTGSDFFFFFMTKTSQDLKRQSHPSFTYINTCMLYSWQSMMVFLSHSGDDDDDQLDFMLASSISGLFKSLKNCLSPSAVVLWKD